MTLLVSAGITGALLGGTLGGQMIRPPADWEAVPPPPTATATSQRQTVGLSASHAASPVTTIETTTPIVPPARVQLPVLERFVDDTFSTPASGWLVRSTTRSDAAYVDGRYQLTLHGDTAISMSFSMPLERYRLSADVYVDAGQAGLVFVAAKPTTFVRLLIDRDGRYAVAQQHEDVTRYLVDWTPSAALAAGSGAPNHLVVERDGRTIQLMANDHPLGEPLLMTLTDTLSGQYGLALASAEGQGRATFDNVVGERLPEP